MDTTKLVQLIGQPSIEEPNSVYLVLCALLGAAYHFSLKYKRLRQSAGMHFDSTDFWHSEISSIIASLLAILLAILCKEQITQLRVGSIVVGMFIYPTFAGIGYCGDSIVDKLMGGYEKKVKKILKF